jgi:ADP-ribosylglycohydrolase
LRLLNKTDIYRRRCLKAVSLDKDTIGSLTVGFAGLLYGFDTIPSIG